MLKELLGKRPEDFDEPAIRASPTFAKWIELPQRGKLRYANRSYVKGKGDDEEKLMRRIMVALKQQAKLSQQGEAAPRDEEVEKGKDESEELLQIQKQSLYKTVETKHRTSTSTETTASTSTTPESEDDDDDDDVERATNPVAAVVAEAGTRVPDPVIVTAEGERTTDPPEALVRTASCGSDSVAQDWFAVQCPAELSEACRLRSLCTSGPRSQLVMRLAEHDAAVAELEAAEAMKAARAKAAMAARWVKAAAAIAAASLATEEAEAAAAEARAEAARAAQQANEEAEAARVAAERAAAGATERAAAEAEAAAAREHPQKAEAAVAVASGAHEEKSSVHQAEKHPVGSTAAAALTATVAATAAPAPTTAPRAASLPDSITTSETSESLSVVSGLSMHSTSGGDTNIGSKKIHKKSSNKKKQQHEETTNRTYYHPDPLSLSKHHSRKQRHKAGSSNAPADAAGELSSSRHNKIKKQPTSVGELSSSRHSRRSVLLMGRDGGGRDARVRMKTKAAEITC